MTTQKFMPELAEHSDRIAMLQESAVNIEVTEYFVPLSQDALDQKREEFTDNSIWLGDQKAKMKELVDEHKERIKPKSEKNAELLIEITTKQEKKEGTIYSVPDYDSGMMMTYDQDGDLVSSRRLRPEEKKGQSRLFVPSQRTGTND